MTLATGALLGPYRILDRLGAGGMGEVYRALDTKLEREVAIKVLPQAVARDPDRLARFEREAKVLALLNHPNIATIYGLEEFAEGMALAMELVQGTTLPAPMPVAEALRIAVQIADALAAAHAKGVTHRDLKPANIMLAASGVKLLDFGLAKVDAPRTNDETVTQTQAGTVMGTPAYMSPEQVQGRAGDARSDIFSFGVVLYELLSGRRAFQGESVMATMAAILKDEPAFLDAPASAQAVVARCLRKVPGERFQSAGDLKAALEEAASSASERRPSLAVLPFANLSADKDNEYFSDGLAEEILSALTQLPGLRVIARASAFAFRGRENAIAEIGEKLRVSSVLHGSVRRAGSRVRVSVQLINVADESQLWAERYDREMRDVFDIQDEIAQAIVAQLQVKLGSKAGQPIVKRYTENPEAHSMYLKGRFQLLLLIPDQVIKGRELLQQALMQEPAYAPAWVALAESYVAEAYVGISPPLSTWAKARAASRRALEADPQLAEAHAITGLLDAMSEYRWEDGLHELDAAIRLKPDDAKAHFWRGDVLYAMGRAGEALAEVKQAVDLDPLSVMYHYRCSLILGGMGEIERVMEHVRQMVDIDDQHLLTRLALGHLDTLQGRHDQAFQRLSQLRNASTSYIGIGFRVGAMVRAGRRTEAELAFSEMEGAREKQFIPAGALALMAAFLGDPDVVFRYAREAAAGRDPSLSLLLRGRVFDWLRPDPRYEELLREMNLRSY